MTAPNLTTIEVLKPSQITLHALNKILLSISSMQSLDGQIEACGVALSLYYKMTCQRAEEARHAPIICPAIGD